VRALGGVVVRGRWGMSAAGRRFAGGARGYPPKMLQEIMGHASITTTLDLYGHLYPGDMDRCADRLDTAIEEASTAKIRPNETGEGEAGEVSAR
jgi:hypothetical protein